MKKIIIMSLLFVGCESLPFWEHDNPVEERLEEIIKENTGYDLDLTPSSPERPERHEYNLDINF